MCGQVFAWVLIALGIMQFFGGNWLGGIWMGLIGMFLNTAAKSSYGQVIARQLLSGEPVSRFMTTHPIVVPPDIDLRHWVDEYVYRYHRKLFPVASDGHLEGVVGTGALGQFPQQEWGQHRVADIMRRDLAEITIAPNADALDAMAKMRRSGSSRLLVTQGDQLVGIVSLKDLLKFLHLKLELEEDGSGSDSAPTDHGQMS
jgi:CBS domain-containing protein